LAASDWKISKKQIKDWLQAIGKLARSELEDWLQANWKVRSISNWLVLVE
jgi:hypothetical protein